MSTDRSSLQAAIRSREGLPFRNWRPLNAWPGEIGQEHGFSHTVMYLYFHRNPRTHLKVASDFNHASGIIYRR